MKTYLTEIKDDKGHQVTGYHRTLTDAKEALQGDESILMMQGMYFGEGFHKYRLVKTSNGKFKRFTSSFDIKNN